MGIFESEGEEEDEEDIKWNEQGGMGWLIRISAQFEICDLCNYPRDKNVNAFIESHSSDTHPDPPATPPPPTPRVMEMIKSRLSAKSRLNHLWERISMLCRHIDIFARHY